LQETLKPTSLPQHLYTTLPQEPKPTMIARTPYLLLIAALAMVSTKVSADAFSDSFPFANQINAAGEAMGVWLQDRTTASLTALLVATSDN
ncbi:hypothetical protein BGW39_000259, partial [Mortierella sp. 14UC]